MEVTVLQITHTHIPRYRSLHYHTVMLKLCVLVTVVSPAVTSCHQLSPTTTTVLPVVPKASQLRTMLSQCHHVSPSVTYCHPLSPTVTPYCHHLPLTLTKGYHLCQYLLTLSQPELIIKDLLFQIYTLIFLPFTILKSFW